MTVPYSRPDDFIAGQMDDYLPKFIQKIIILQDSARKQFIRKMIIWQNLPEEWLYCKILAEKWFILQISNKRERVRSG